STRWRRRWRRPQGSRRSDARLWAAAGNPLACRRPWTLDSTPMVGSLPADDALVLIPRDGHALDQDRAARAPAARHDVAPDGDDRAEHLAQVAGDGDLLHREADLAVLDPVAGRAARIVAGDEVDALPHQLGHQQPFAHLLEHSCEIGPFRTYEEVVVAAGVAGTLHAELARRVGAEKIALDHPGAHDGAIARRHAFLVEGSARHRPGHVRALLDIYERREQLLTETLRQERGLAIEIAAIHRGDEVADELECHRRLEQHRRLAGGNLARPQAGERALAGVAAEHHGIGKLFRAARCAVPVVALHQPLVFGDHRARQPVPRAGIAA